MRPPPIPRQLELRGRQTSPLVMPSNRDVSLESEGPGLPDFPVKIALHHTVPDSRLRLFFNDILYNQHLLYIRRALQALQQNIGGYVDVDLANYRQARVVAVQVAECLATGRWIQDYGEPGRQADGAHEMDAFGMFWCNMPGNLFAGPKTEKNPYRRAVADDPQDAFEGNAHLAMPGDRHGRLRMMDDFMRQYIQRTTTRRNGAGPPRGIPDHWDDPLAISLAKSATQIYADIASRRSYEALRPEVWELHNRDDANGATLEDRYRLYRRNG